ncbi:hypothetical protein HDV05_000538 [Chytridiales sp. JEL 0842]|nr:hypothetical protein HDV05_000538 [Chytridiales sp. JEL 0842]
MLRENHASILGNSERNLDTHDHAPSDTQKTRHTTRPPSIFGHIFRSNLEGHVPVSPFKRNFNDPPSLPAEAQGAQEGFPPNLVDLSPANDSFFGELEEYPKPTVYGYFNKGGDWAKSARWASQSARSDIDEQELSDILKFGGEIESIDETLNGVLKIYSVTKSGFASDNGWTPTFESKSFCENNESVPLGDSDDTDFSIVPSRSKSAIERTSSKPLDSKKCELNRTESRSGLSTGGESYKSNPSLLKTPTTPSQQNDRKLSFSALAQVEKPTKEIITQRRVIVRSTPSTASMRIGEGSFGKVTDTQKVVVRNTTPSQQKIKPPSNGINGENDGFGRRRYLGNDPVRRRMSMMGSQLAHISQASPGGGPKTEENNGVLESLLSVQQQQRVTVHETISQISVNVQAGNESSTTSVSSDSNKSNDMPSENKVENADQVSSTLVDENTLTVEPRSQRGSIDQGGADIMESTSLIGGSSVTRDNSVMRNESMMNSVGEGHILREREVETVHVIQKHSGFNMLGSTTDLMGVDDNKNSGPGHGGGGTSMNNLNNLDVAERELIRSLENLDRILAAKMQHFPKR